MAPDGSAVDSVTGSTAQRGAGDVVVRRRLLLTGMALALTACAPAATSGVARSVAGLPDPTARPDPGASSTPEPTTTPESDADEPAADDPRAEEQAAEQVGNGDDVDPADYPAEASEWGEQVSGVRTRLDTGDRVVALTFDACGGDSGSGLDRALIDHLVDEQVPATLFFNQRWIEANEESFRDLAAEPLFELGNHGSAHLPLSVTGRSAYGIAGTESPAAVVDEIQRNQDVIHRLAGRRPRWFRSGTAHYDEVAVRIVRDLGYEVVNYDVLGDAGATFSAAQVAAAVGGSQPGSIALLHMNHPDSGTAAGIREAVPTLRADGFSFVQLSAYGLR